MSAPAPGPDAGSVTNATASMEGAAIDSTEADGSVDASTLIIIRGTAPDANARSDAPASIEGGRDSADAADCDIAQDPRTAPCLLSDEYGIFVAVAQADGTTDSAVPTPFDAGSVGGEIADAAPGAGTMLHPVASIAQAIGLAAANHKKRVFVCNGTYPEQVTLGFPLDLYGGLSCAIDASGARTWAYSGGQAKVVSPSATFAISLPGSSTPIRIEDFSFVAADAVSPPGASSVAAWVVSSTVSFRRVTLRAGRGADGAPGADGRDDPNYDAQSSAPPGLAPGLDDLPAPYGGLPGPTNECLRSGQSVGGNGGAGCGEGGLTRLWPFAKFPVLRDRARDQVVPESSVIIEYLAQHHPGDVRLLPADPDRALETRLQDRFYDVYVHEPMQKIVGDKLRPAGQNDPYGVAHARGVLETAYGMIETRMSARAWATGDSFGMADCAAAPALYYANRVHPFGAARKNTAAYLSRLEERPSVRRVMTEARPYFHLFPGESRPATPTTVK